MPERKFMEDVLGIVVSLKVAAEHLERALSYHAASLSAEIGESETDSDWDGFLDSHPELGADDA